MHARSAQFKEFKRKYAASHSLIALEAQLARSGLLTVLEEDGVVPVVDSPNPHHPEAEREMHERWWYEHPESRSAYHTARRARESAILLILLGSMVGGMFGEMSSAQPKTK